MPHELHRPRRSPCGSLRLPAPRPGRPRGRRAAVHSPVPGGPADAQGGSARAGPRRPTSSPPSLLPPPSPVPACADRRPAPVGRSARRHLRLRGWPVLPQASPVPPLLRRASPVRQSRPASGSAACRQEPRSGRPPAARPVRPMCPAQLARPVPRSQSQAPSRAKPLLLPLRRRPSPRLPSPARPAGQPGDPAGIPPARPGRLQARGPPGPGPPVPQAPDRMRPVRARRPLPELRPPRVGWPLPSPRSSRPSPGVR
ncbi:MAG: hypothetical protein QOC91_148 [Solirubrobacteraceae bacterium]|nr:hypothetical protein [Solirubrobacteraceae bacterium]